MEIGYSRSQDLYADWEKTKKFWKEKEPSRFHETFNGFSMKFREFTVYFAKEQENTLRLSFGSIRNIENTDSVKLMLIIAETFKTMEWR